MRPAFIRIAAAASGLLLVVSCSGDMPEPSSAEVLVAYNAKLPTGVEQWSSCTSNGIGQVACETDTPDVKSDEGWTCTACNEQEQETEETEQQVEADSGAAPGFEGFAGAAPPAVEQVLERMAGLEGRVWQPKHEEEAEDDECDACDEDDEDDEEGKSDAWDACGIDVDACFSFDKPHGGENGLDTFLEGLKDYAHSSWSWDGTEAQDGTAGPDRDRSYRSPEKLPDLGEEPTRPSFGHDKGETMDLPERESGHAVAPGSMSPDKATFPKRASSRSTCIRSGLPKGAFDCRAAGQNVNCTGMQHRSALEGMDASRLPKRNIAPINNWGGNQKMPSTPDSLGKGSASWSNKSGANGIGQTDRPGSNGIGQTTPGTEKDTPSKGVLPVDADTADKPAAGKTPAAGGIEQR